MTTLHPLFGAILNQHARQAVHCATPEMVAEFQGIADGIKARLAANRPVPLVIAPVVQTRAELEAELAAERVGFDPAYPFSDDHTFFVAQAAKLQRIFALELLLSGVTE